CAIAGAQFAGKGFGGVRHQVTSRVINVSAQTRSRHNAVNAGNLSRPAAFTTGSGTMNYRVHHDAGLLGRLMRWLAAFRRRPGSVRPGTDAATQEALRDSEERLRLVRRATGLGMYEIDWVARRRYWSPELRAILRVPVDFDIDTDADLLERIIPN